MGAWGTAIFSDDTACDIRREYRELLGDRVGDDEAASQVIASYQHLDVDQAHLLWLALAATQSQLGRLSTEVKARALEIIDNGTGLELWVEAGPKELAKRTAALNKLRAQLIGPQPPRKTLRRPWRHVTDLTQGDVLAFTASNGNVALLRVVRVDDHRVGAAPILEHLDWHGRSFPGGWNLRRLKLRMVRHPLGGLMHEATIRAAKLRMKDPDWRDSGFSFVAHLHPRSTDGQAKAWTLTTWTGLRTTLERELSA